MRGPPPEDETCPTCDEPYDQRVVIERGDRWADIVPGPPTSVYRTFPRQCADSYDVETDTDLPNGELAVYFHRKALSTSFL